MKTRHTVVLLATLVASSLIAGTANGQAVPGEPLDTPFFFSASVGNTFGVATLLADSEYTQTDYFLTNTSVSATYMLDDAISFSASGGVSKYLTSTGGINSQYEARFQDTSLSASIFPLFVERNTGIITTAGINLDLPTSDLSQAEGLYAAGSASFTALKPIGGMILVWSLGFAKNFHEYTSQTFDPTELDIIAREGGTEQLDARRVAVDGVLTSFSVSNTFLIIYNFLPKAQFRTSLTYSDGWTYDNGTITQEDEFTNPNAVTGRGHRQTTVGSFGLRYLILGQSFFGRSLTVSTSVNTVGAPLTSDNSGLRFPFWDFENGQASRTTFNFGLSGTY